MKIAVVGCGHWGKNLVRNFFELGVLTAVCDSNYSSLEMVKNNYPGVTTTNNYDDLFKPELKIDGLVIATPSSTHYELAKQALMAGKNLYVEKPLASSLKEAEELQKLALDRGLVLMVGHLLLYHPAVNKLKTLISQGYLGDIQYINSDRRNFNRNQRRDLCCGRCNL